MNNATTVRRAASWLTLSVAIGLCIAPAAQADPVQIALDNLTFDPAGPLGPEVLTGSFFFDPLTFTVSSVTIAASGATDAIGIGSFQFGIVSPTGNEPNEFLFLDPFGDSLDLALSEGTVPHTYAPADATLTAEGLMLEVGLGVETAGVETASDGSFSVIASSTSPVPEPSSLIALALGLVSCGIARVRRSRRLGSS